MVVATLHLGSRLPYLAQISSRLVYPGISKASSLGEPMLLKWNVGLSPFLQISPFTWTGILES